MTAVVITPRTAYFTADVFRLLVDEWVAVRRCPHPLVDRCIELELYAAAECARWAATEPDRPTYPELLGRDERDGPSGPYPTQNRHRDGSRGKWYWLRSDMSGVVCNASLPLGKESLTASFRNSEMASGPVDAILWLMEHWEDAQ